jgi:hypothetical protein
MRKQRHDISFHKIVYNCVKNSEHFLGKTSGSKSEMVD